MKGKQLMREAIWNGAILSALIIIPMAFFGPGWRSQTLDARLAKERFATEHRVSGSAENNYERDIPILRAFPKQNDEVEPG